MPYWISDANPDCSGWVVEKEDGEVLGCHSTKEDAIAQAVAVSLAEETEFMGERSEKRQVDLEPPAYMRASARRGLEWHAEGLSGDGIVDRTIREARAMAAGNVTSDKWVRIRAWIARHLVDMDAPQNTPGEDGYPGPGAVAMALWGGGGSKRSAERALEYAEGVVARLEAENEGRAKGDALSKLETRIFQVEDFEFREIGRAHV